MKSDETDKKPNYQEQLHLRHLSKVQESNDIYWLGGLVGIVFLISSAVLICLLVVAAREKSKLKNWDEIPEGDSYYVYLLSFIVFAFLFGSYFHWIAYNQFQRNY